MKFRTGDIIAIIFLAAFALLVAFFPFDYAIKMQSFLETGKPVFFWSGFSKEGLRNFQDVTNHFPFIMGFIKFALLATFGEMLKHRMKSGTWMIDKLIPRAIVWGFFGVVITFAFSLFAGGMTTLMDKGIWFGNPLITDRSSGNIFIFAFSTSTAMNLIFAFPFMLGHEWFNKVIETKKLIGGTEFLENIDKHVWGSFIPKTLIYFWIPAHTATFLLPEGFRVLAGAALSVALGFILTIRAVKKQN